MAGDLLRIALTDVEIHIHRDYALPQEVLTKEGTVKNTLVVASSYSGNTEETLDAFENACREKLPVVAITTGGKLLELARERGLPYILMPNTEIQPRMATGFSVMALLSLMLEGKHLKDASTLAKKLDVEGAKKIADELEQKLEGKVPIIYSSHKNFPIAYNWKIKFNETAKIPAFANYFPELNHNEMTGFDKRSGTKPLSEKYHFIFLKDSDADGLKMNKRMGVLAKMLKDSEFGVEELAVEGQNSLVKIFQSLLVADWTSCMLARHYHVDPEHVPMVEEFKKQIE